MKPYYSDDLVTIYHGDCRLRAFWSGTFERADVVITDPPYGTGGWRRPRGGAGSSPVAGLVREAWDDGAVDWLRLKPTITFWPPARTWALLVAANERGLTKHRALYWQKPDPKPQVGGRTRWSIEPIWVLSEEGFVLYGDTDLYRESAIRANRNAEAVGHPYLDPFMGSGSTLVAAKSLGRTSVGIEADEAWCEVAANRCRQEVLGLAG